MILIEFLEKNKILRHFSPSILKPSGDAIVFALLFCNLPPDSECYMAPHSFLAREVFDMATGRGGLEKKRQ